MWPDRRRALAAVLALMAVPQRPLQAQVPSPDKVSAPPLRVVASFSILADMARQVGGDAVSVQSLVAADADAHHFSPKPQHAQMLRQAEVVVVNGLGFEGWMQRLIKASGYKGPVVETTRGLTPLRAGAHPDPHAWQDLSMAQQYVSNLATAFGQARPAQAALFAQRAGEYRQQMQSLDADIKQRLAKLAPERRRVVSPHDALGYFGAAYGIEFLPVRGRQPDSEASAADVARLIETLRKRRAHAVFVENISDPRLLQRIAQEAGVRVGGKLYTDALTAPGTPADTYLKMFAHNANTLIEALSPKP